jgi:hypothetical protein
MFFSNLDKVALIWFDKALAIDQNDPIGLCDKRLVLIEAAPLPVSSVII